MYAAGPLIGSSASHPACRFASLAWPARTRRPLRRRLRHGLLCRAALALRPFGELRVGPPRAVPSGDRLRAFGLP